MHLCNRIAAKGDAAGHTLVELDLGLGHTQKPPPAHAPPAAFPILARTSRPSIGTLSTTPAALSPSRIRRPMGLGGWECRAQAQRVR